MALLKENILVIDNDESISYQRNTIDSSYIYKICMKELLSVFENNPDDIFKYDTTNCILLIMSDGSEIPLNEYKGNSTDIEFIKISLAHLRGSDNEIILACNEKFGKNFLISPTAMPWQTTEKRILKNAYNPDDYYNRNARPGFNAEIRMSGYKNTINIINTLNQHTKIGNYLGDCPCARYCYNLKIKSNDYLYQGYLPAAHQLGILKGAVPLINHILKDTGLNLLDGPTDFFSSTESDHDINCYGSDYARTVWAMDISNKSKLGRPVYKSRISDIYTMPFFKKIPIND